MGQVPTVPSRVPLDGYRLPHRSPLSEPLKSASHRLSQLHALDDSGRDIAVRDHAVQVDVGCEAVQVLRKQDLNQIIGGKRSDRCVDG